MLQEFKSINLERGSLHGRLYFAKPVKNDAESTTAELRTNAEGKE